MNENKERLSGKNVFLLIGLCIVLILVLLGFNVFQGMKLNKFIAYQMEKDADAAEASGDYIEDGYVIEGGYEIISTTAISDAYLAGDTSGDSSGLTDTEKETLQMAVAVLDEVVTEDMTLVEKEEAIYNWIFDNVSIGSSTVISATAATDDNYTPHGVLKGKKAVCVGFATTFRLLMNMVGADVHIVHNEYHSWDLVQLDDGGWYHVDLYSDVSGPARYANFNMTDSMATMSHEWEGSSLPAANQTTYCAANMFKEELDSLYDLPASVASIVESGNSESAFYSFDEDANDELLAVGEKMVSSISEAVMMMGYSMDISGYWYDLGDNEYVLHVMVTNYSDGYSESGDASLSDDVLEKIQNSVSDAFDVDISEYESYDSYDVYTDSDGEVLKEVYSEQ